MAAKSGESKQVLVIFLVFFVLLSIGLGVLAYYGYAEQDALAKKEAEATKKAKDWEKDADWYKFQALLFRSYMGHPIAAAEEDLKTLRSQYETNDLPNKAKQDKFKEDNLKLIRETLDKQLGWDANEKRPVKTYEKELAALKDQNQTLKAEWKQKQDQLADSEQKLKMREDELVAARKQYQENLNTLEATNLKNTEEYRQTIDRQQRQLEQDGAKNGQALIDKGKEVQSLQQLIVKKDEQIDQQSKRIQKYVEQSPKFNRVAYDHPKGTITAIDPTGKMPFISLGSSDNVKPQLTFSIHGVDPNGRPKKEPKGSLEVIRIVGDHVAQARVTDLADPKHDPVMRGDFLFNIAWSPQLRQHVVVIGIIDLTGDGRDSMPQFLRGLQKQNVIVDAYLDMKTLEVKGEITRQTDYLILGDNPTYSGGMVLGRDDNRGDRTTRAIEKIGKLRRQAENFGVNVIWLKDYLAMSGYRIPRPLQSRPEDYPLHPTMPAVGSHVDRPIQIPNGNGGGR